MARMDEYQQAAFDLVERLLTEGAAGQVVKVKAGAGSGKTFVLVRMLVASPADTVGMSFTRKAGNELGERVRRLDRHCDAFLGTTHRYAGALLREHSKAWSMGRCLSLERRAPGLPSDATIWHAVVGWNRDGIPGLSSVRCLGLDLPSGLSWKDYSLAAGKVYGAGITNLSSKEAKALIKSFGEELPDFGKVFGLFRRSTKAIGGWTFDQQLHAGMVLLSRGRGPRPAAVFVDEAQDNNATQLRFASILAEKGLLVRVGDARQSIYGFTGAAVDVFMEGADYEVELRSNYRSGSRIVAASNYMAKDQDWADGSDSVAARGTKGEVREWFDPDYEVAVAGEILADVKSGRKLERNIAILCRTNMDATNYEIALREAGLRVNRLGAKSFLELALPKAFLAWCVLADDDCLTSLDEAKNAPTKRYLGHAFIPAVEALEGRPGDTLIAALVRVAKGKKFQGAKVIADIMAKLRRLPTWEAKVEAVEAMFAAELPPSDPTKGPRAQLAGIARTAARLQDADGVWALIDAPTKTNDDGVVVSTQHKSKGLEWGTVYVDAKSRKYDPNRPPQTAADTAESGRLAYVAVTRARDELVLVAPEPPLAPFYQAALEGS